MQWRLTAGKGSISLSSSTGEVVGFGEIGCDNSLHHLHLSPALESSESAALEVIRAWEPAGQVSTETSLSKLGR